MAQLLRLRLAKVLLVVVVAGWTRALDNGAGRLPLLEWASWNTFVDVGLNESVIRETADAMVAHGLKRLGFSFVNVDCGWSAANRTEAGDIQPDPDRFPSGMAALGRYLHDRGLRFGLYTARGPRECCGRTGYSGSQHAVRDAETFASWGVDYLKVRPPLASCLHPWRITALGCHLDYLKVDSCGWVPDVMESQWDQFAAM